jgi:hypothetical protein
MNGHRVVMPVQEGPVSVSAPQPIIPKPPKQSRQAAKKKNWAASNAVRVKGSKGGRPTKHPWDKVRDHFVTSTNNVTIKEVAAVYGISYDVVRVKASQERWSYLRADYQTAARQKAFEERLELLSAESIRFDDSNLKAAQLGVNLILGRLTQMAQMFQAHGANWETVLQKVRASQPLAPHEARAPFSYKELTEMAAALERFQNVGRKALGTDVQQIDIMAQSTTTHEVTISSELEKPDRDRIAATLGAMNRAGLLAKLQAAGALPGGPASTDASDGAETVSDGSVVPQQTPSGERQGGTSADDVVDAEIVG